MLITTYQFFFKMQMYYLISHSKLLMTIKNSKIPNGLWSWKNLNLQMLDFFIHAQEHNEINIVYWHPKFTHTKVD